MSRVGQKLESVQRRSLEDRFDVLSLSQQAEECSSHKVAFTCTSRCTRQSTAEAKLRHDHCRIHTAPRRLNQATGSPGVTEHAQQRRVPWLARTMAIARLNTQSHLYTQTQGHTTERCLRGGGPSDIAFSFLLSAMRSPSSSALWYDSSCANTRF